MKLAYLSHDLVKNGLMSAVGQSEKYGGSHAMSALGLPADRYSQIVEITGWKSACLP